MIDWLFEKVMWPLCVILAVTAMLLLLVGLPIMLYAAYQDSKSPTFSLRKDRWECTESEQRTHTTFVMSGKVMIPITTTENHCLQWSEK